MQMIFSVFQRLLLLSVVAIAALSLNGCTAASPKDLIGIENNSQIIPDMIRYFEKNGITITSVTLVRPDVIHADDGIAIQIEGKEIGIYKFNTNIRKQREKLFRIQEEGFVHLVGIKKNVLINGTFIMVGWDDNPKKEELEKVFMRFK